MIIFIISATISVIQIIEIKNQEQNAYSSVSPFLNDVNSNELIIYNNFNFFYPYYNVYRNYEAENLCDTISNYTNMTLIATDIPRDNLNKIMNDMYYTHNIKLWGSLDNSQLKIINEKLGEKGYGVIEQGNFSTRTNNYQLFYIEFK
jgi:hypothetical protein